MPGKVIFIVSSCDKDLDKGDDKKEKTGWYLPEAAHPYKEISEAGFQIVFVSPKGGAAPMDVSSGAAFANDKVCIDFLDKHREELEKTLKPSDVKGKESEFDGLFYVGGHGPMFDLPENTEIAVLARDIYEKGGVLGAVCHGTVGFVPVKLSNGEYVVKGHKVASFTNAEEDAMKLSKQMPFMLETKLGEIGATFVGADNWSCNVQVSGRDGRLISGQNPNSATLCGQEMVKAMKAKQSKK